MSKKTVKKKRIEEIDILKALGIICMVAGHSGAPFTHFVYLFHMAIFFMASGFCFKDTDSDNIKSVIKAIKNKFKQLWLPFFAWNTIYVLLANVFIKINVYTDNPEILDYILASVFSPYSASDIIWKILKGAAFSGCEQIYGASWFLRTLFMVSVGYSIGDFLR